MRLSPADGQKVPDSLEMKTLQQRLQASEDEKRHTCQRLTEVEGEARELAATTAKLEMEVSAWSWNIEDGNTFGAIIFAGLNLCDLTSSPPFSDISVFPECRL